ncbi:MAG TPA: Holliday junction branch migration protein RuvA [Candidatus Acidoferrales bacterium]|nr:Holliday junction branch migration protein RuvA [Candidatus Acidoferrales bacterium]
MIGQLRGVLADKRPNQVLVEVGGVGYQVQIPLSTFAGLGALHSEVTLLIHTHLREDQIALYGFLTAREKQCFEMLISATGVGPSLALKILSGISLGELVPAIRKGDVVRLKSIPGVGQKTAERIVVELRDKLAAVDVAETGKPAARSQVEADVASALVNLGYEARMVEKTLQQVRGNGDSGFDILLRAALRKLGGTAAVEKSAGAGRGD